MHAKVSDRCTQTGPPDLERDPVGSDGLGCPEPSAGQDVGSSMGAYTERQKRREG